MLLVNTTQADIACRTERKVRFLLLSYWAGMFVICGDIARHPLPCTMGPSRTGWDPFCFSRKRNVFEEPRRHHFIILLVFSFFCLKSFEGSHTMQHQRIYPLNWYYQVIVDPKIAGYPFSRDIAPTLFQKRNRPSNSKIILIPIHGIGLIQTPSWANPHAAQDSFADPRSDSDGRNLVIRTTKYFAGVVAPSDLSSLAFVAGGVGKCWEGFKQVKILFGVPAMFQFF